MTEFFSKSNNELPNSSVSFKEDSTVSVNPICHGVFSTFVVMGARRILLIDKWEKSVAFVNKSSTFYAQNVIVRYWLTLFFFWWRHHKLKTPTEIPSFLHICMACLILHAFNIFFRFYVLISIEMSIYW